MQDQVYKKDSLAASAGEAELPGTVVSLVQRNSCKELVRKAAEFRSSHELMFLAGAFEDAAYKKRAQENRA